MKGKGLVSSQKDMKPVGKTENKAVASAAKKGGKSDFEQKVEANDVKPEGTMGKRRIDRPGRKLGGKVGADMAPLSSAHKSTRC